MNYRITYTRSARAELRETEEYLIDFSKRSAITFHNRLKKIIEILKADPHRYPEAREASELGIPLRMAIFGRKPHVYRVLFIIKESDVNIVAIRHAARDDLQESDL